MLAHAETSKFSHGDLNVIPARTILASGTDMTFQVGENLEFLKAPGFPATEKVSVRLFALPADAKVPTSWKVFEPCLVFVTSLEHLVLNPTGPIKLFKLTKSWLDSSADGTVKAQRYLAVFERRNSDKDEMLRINRNDSATYFANGVVIVISPERVYAKSDGMEMAERRAQRSAEGQEAANRNSSSYRCYTVKSPTAATEEGGDLYAMSDCPPEVAVY
jgi:hypothetical protein